MLHIVQNQSIYEKNLLLLCWLSIFTYATAGDDNNPPEKKKKIIVTVSIGTDISFGLAQLGSHKALPAKDSSHLYGYSDLGYYFNISVGYQITDVLGIMASFNGNFDDFNAVAFQNAYANTTANPVAGEGVTASGNYFLTKYLVGPFFEIPTSRNKLSKTCIKVLGGPMHCNYPTLTATEGYTYTQSVPNGKGFSYCLGVGYEAYASEHVRIYANTGYSRGTLTYASETFTQTGFGVDETYISYSSRTMTVGLIQLSSGVVFLF